MPNRSPRRVGVGLGHGAQLNWWSRSHFILSPAWASGGQRIRCRSDCRSTSARNLRFSNLTTKIFLNAVALWKTLETTGERPQTSWRFPGTLRKPGHGYTVRVQGSASSRCCCATRVHALADGPICIEPQDQHRQKTDTLTSCPRHPGLNSSETRVRCGASRPGPVGSDCVEPQDQSVRVPLANLFFWL